MNYRAEVISRPDMTYEYSLWSILNNRTYKLTSLMFEIVYRCSEGNTAIYTKKRNIDQYKNEIRLQKPKSE
jgi:hypothetical protein